MKKSLFISTFTFLVLSEVCYSETTDSNTPGANPPPAPTNPKSPKYIPQSEVLAGSPQTITEATEKEKIENPDFIKHEKRRAQGQKIQEAGEVIGDITGVLHKSFHLLPLLVSHIPEPHAKAAGTAVSVTLECLNLLGIATSKVLISTGRYMERSQQFTTVNEILINKTIEAIQLYKELDKELQDLLSPGQSSGALMRAPAKVGRKITDLSDTLGLTKAKSEREQQIKDLAARVKSTGFYAEDLVRTLQIKLLQDGVTFIDRLMNKDAEIEKLKSQIDEQNAEKAKLEQQLSQVMATKGKKQKPDKEAKSLQSNITALQQSVSEIQKQIDLLINSPTKDPIELKQERELLIKQIEEIKPLTRLGKSEYLATQGFENLFTKSGIIEIVRRIEELKEGLCSLENKSPKIDQICKSN